MEPPAEPPPPVVVAAESTERPGPLGERAWRIQARRQDDALEQVVRWIEQPNGRIVLLVERDPALSDVLALPERGEATRPEPAAEAVPA